MRKIFYLRITVTALICLLMLGNVGSVFAEGVQPDKQQVIEALTPYVHTDENQFVLENVPEVIKEKVGSQNLEAILKNIDLINENAEDGILTVTDNGTVYQSNDVFFTIQGGNITKLNWTWYGCKIYLSNYYVNKITAGATIGAVAALYIPEPAISKGIGAALGLSAGLLAWNNAEGEGVVMKVWLYPPTASIFWISSQ